MISRIIHLYIRFSGFWMWLFWLLIHQTIRFKISGDTNWKEFTHQKGPLIFVFWHQATFSLFYYFRGSDISLITMNSLKGQVLAAFARRCGFTVYSFADSDDSREGARTLVELKKIIERGETIGLAVDGPEGPLHEVKV